jgi:hypothetical protein
MIFKTFTVYDSKTEAYLQPFFVNSKGAAIRSFSDASNEPGHQFNKYPEDFTLFELGEYDDATAELTRLDALVSLGTAIEFIKDKVIPTNGA